jgi:hypothetical protein
MKNMKKGATLSTCKTYRWTLTRDWGDGKRICWVMLNPSTADHNVDDQTILRCIHFTRFWGYSGFTVVNLYPYRSPSPAKCKAWATDARLANSVKKALRQNAAVVVEHSRDASMVIAAWGGNVWDPEWRESIVESLLTGACSEIYCLETTDGGAPKHPMARGKHRVPNDQQPELWKTHAAP